ncbi:hypothetical protein Tco_0328782 [Tanacetum coccineum]
MITWQRYWDMVIIRLGMLRSQGFTTWKDLDITYSPLGNSVIRTLKLLFVNTPASFGIFFGPLRVASVNGKKYILVIVDDYSRFTCEASDTQQVRTALHEMTHATTSSGLVQNPPPSTSFVPPSRTDLEIDPSPDKCALLLYIGIYKVKLDEFGGILRTVSRLVARGYVKNKELILRNPFAPVARLDDPFRIFSHMLIT